MSGRLSRVVWLRSLVHIRAQQQTLLLRQGRENVGIRRFAIAQPEQKANEGATASSYTSSSKVRQETAREQQSSSRSQSKQKPDGCEPEGGGKATEDPASKTASGAASAAAGAGEFFADTFVKGFSFASASATAGFKKLKDAKFVDAVKDSYTFLKEELNTPPSRRRVKDAGVSMSNVEKSDETAIVPVITKRSAWQKRLDDIMEKARQHPVYKRLRRVKQHPVVAKSQELAEDLRERWETSDSPVVHKIQDLNDSLFGETATAVAMREIRRRDPLFSVPDFMLEVQDDIRPILIAYLKGDYKTLRKKCSREVVDRCRAERIALESQGIYLDHKILHISDVEVKETKLMGNSPIIIVSFQTQQIYCARDKAGNITQGAKDDIHTVFYAWAMQQLSSEELEEGEIHPRWQLREMQQLGIQAII
ncbi:unnamed protein product [Calypogeia fissa]